MYFKCITYNSFTEPGIKLQTSCFLFYILWWPIVFGLKVLTAIYIQNDKLCLVILYLGLTPNCLVSNHEDQI